MPPAKPFSFTNRILLGTLIIVLALLLLAAGWTVPFKYPSFSILYKFGRLKLYLRYGKEIGISVALLLFFQVVLAARLGVLERVFSARTLLALHRLNGFVIGAVAAVHPLLIKASDNFVPYTFTKTYYPEFVGMGLLFVVLTVFLSAVFRNFLKMPYTRWRLLHRVGATVVLFLIPAHVLYVSDSFKTAGLPRSGAIAVFSLNLLLISYVWLKRLFGK